MRLSLMSASALALAACAPASAPAAAPAGSAASTAAETPTAAAEEIKLPPAGTYTLDLGHASLLWRVSHFGLSDYTARFTKFDATLELNPADLASTRLTATIDPTSVETDYPGDYKATHATSPHASWDEDLANDPKWFNSAVHPQITFTTTAVTPVTPSTAKVTGDLTFLGVTKPVTLDVTYNGVANFPWAPDVDKIGFSATGKLKRSDFGMTALQSSIGDDVEIIIEAEFAEVTAPDGAAQ